MCVSGEKARVCPEKKRENRYMKALRVDQWIKWLEAL
jgi:hypothetical protein